MVARTNKTEVLDIKNEADIINARVKVKALAETIGFDYMDQTRIATAASELTRNALEHGGGGQLTIIPIDNGEKKGLEIVVEDHGPGIANLEFALRGGYSSSGGLGFGLSGSKKLMDSLTVKTVVGEGTVVKAKKWLRK